MCYKLINIFLILLSLIVSVGAKWCQVVLHAHYSCPNSLRALKIITKLEQKVPKQKIKFTKIIKGNNNNNLFSLIDRRSTSLVYPTIQIKEQSKIITYQNQFSLVQLQYWISIHCFKKIPNCAPWMPQPLFPIRLYQPNQNQKSYNRFQKFMQFIYKYSPIKICIDSTLPIDIIKQKQSVDQALNGIQNAVSQLMHEIPVFLKFNHNIRNFLLQHSQKTAIMYIYNHKTPFHIQIKDKLLEIIQFIRRRDPRISYHLTQKAKQSLIFIFDKYNSHMVTRLLNFLAIDASQVAVNPLIIGFGFRGNQGMKKIEEIQYKVNEDTVLDNKFVYWLQQVTLSITNEVIRNKLLKTQNKDQKICKYHEITHYYQYNNVKQIVQNIKVLKIASILIPPFQNQGLEFYEKEIFTQIFNFYRQSPESTNDSLFQFNKVISEDQLSFFSQFQFAQKFQSIISEPILYSSPRAFPLKLCLIGHEPIRFMNFLQLFILLKQKKLIRLRQNLQTQITLQEFLGRRDTFDQQL